MPRRRYTAVPPSILILLVPIVALILLLFIFSLSSHILIRPITVKKSWDSINIFLVLFAVLCGLVARRNNDEIIAGDEEIRNPITSPSKEKASGNNEWFDSYYYSCTTAAPVSGGGRLKRNSSSYPDLRHDYWPSETGESSSRFFDDLDMYKHRHHRSPEFKNTAPLGRVKTESRDHYEKVMLPSSPPPPPQIPEPPPQPSPKITHHRPKQIPEPPAPPPPPPKITHRRPRTMYKSTRPRDTPHDSSEIEVLVKEPPPPSLPPPSASAPVTVVLTEKPVGNGRKMSNATKEIKTVLALLYSHRKRKKKLKRKNVTDDFVHVQHEPVYSTKPPPSPPPPPPPLPPPPSVFYNLFRKDSKSKRIHSSSAVAPPLPPPPPPPPPPSKLPKVRIQNPVTSPQLKSPTSQSSRRRSTGKPPLSNRTSQFSPLNPMPMPPPLPSLDIPQINFMIRGDFARIQSRDNSPELEEIDTAETKDNPEEVRVTTAAHGNLATATAFCPSPDVNAKADTFIARLKDGWRLEKMNSMKETLAQPMYRPS